MLLGRACCGLVRCSVDTLARQTRRWVSAPSSGDRGLTLYVDGSCLQKDGCAWRAGWGVVALDGQQHCIVNELWGPVVLDRTSGLYMGAAHSSNNTAELCALGEALLWLRDEEGVDDGGGRGGAPSSGECGGVQRRRPALLRHDSTYAANVVTGAYRANKNVELVRTVSQLLAQVRAQRPLEFEHVKAHSNEVWNDRADTLAKHGARGALCISTERYARARLREPEFSAPSAEVLAALSEEKRQQKANFMEQLDALPRPPPDVSKAPIPLVLAARSSSSARARSKSRAKPAAVAHEIIVW
jgi:ribonuclease HI